MAFKLQTFEEFSAVNEIHYQDIYSDVFQEFMSKYKRLKNDKNLYVQFTNYKGDVLDKSTHENPDHYDPLGNYAYPLDYVINYPADVWYGQNANNIRILKKNLKTRTLNLSRMNYVDIDYLLRKVFKREDIPSEEEVIEKFKDRIYPKNSGYNGRLFFQIIQYNFKTNEVRSGKEQSDILLKMGYNAIEDTSKSNNTAVINNREPEQICFLNRNSFDVIEIFKSGIIKSNQLAITTDVDRLIPKWAAIILDKVFDDKIKERGKKYDKDTFYSIHGRTIKIYFSYTDEYYIGKKIGEKKHKEFKLFTHQVANIFIITEKGTIDYTSTTSDSLLQIIDDIKKEWNAIKDKPTLIDWIPRSIQQKEIEDQKFKELHAKQEKEKEYQEFKKIESSFYKKTLEWKTKINSTLDVPSIGSKELHTFYVIFDKLNNMVRMNYITGMIEDIDNLLLKTDPIYFKLKFDSDIPVELIKEYLLFFKEVALAIVQETGDKQFFYANYMK